MYKACENEIKTGLDSGYFRSSAWGKEKDQKERIIDEHFNKIVVHLDPTKQKTPEETLLVVQSMTNRLGAIRNVFPFLTLVADNIYIHDGERGGRFVLNESDDPRITWSWKHIEPLSLIIPNSQFDGEQFNIASIHEYQHGVEQNYFPLKQVMTLEEYVVIPTQLVKSTTAIAYDFFNLTADYKEFVNYGLVVRLNNASRPERQQIFNNAINYLNFAFPKDIQIEDNDDDMVIDLKHEKQFNFMIHAVGKSMLFGSKELTNTSPARDASEKLMEEFFEEVTHHLVGPFQVGQPMSRIPNTYDNIGKTGIGVHNLEMHKVRMRTFVNPDIGEDPAAIRHNLGLPDINL